MAYDSPNSNYSTTVEVQTASERLQSARDGRPPSTKADVVAGTTGEDRTSGKHPRDQMSPKNRTPDSISRAALANKLDGLAERLLAPLRVPNITLDRKLLPENLCTALELAGLDTPEALPTTTLMTLAAINTIAGPGVHCEAGDELSKLTGKSGDLSIRVALTGSDNHTPQVPAAILSGVFAAESDALNIHTEITLRDAELRRIAEHRRKLYEQASRAAEMLGIAPLPRLAGAAPAQLLARPRIVVADGTSVAVRTAAAGGTGVLLVDKRRMPSLATVGDHYDFAIDGLLNTAAAGHPVPVANPDGHMVMRSLPISVFGILPLTDCAMLHKAGRPQLTATVFMPATSAPAGHDGSPLTALMRKVRVLGCGRVHLRLPAKSSILAATSADWVARAAQSTPPLSDYWAVLPDLGRRLAAALHLAAAADDGIPSEITSVAMERAIAIIENCVVPIAHSLLAPVSTTEVERDARRVIAFLRQNSSITHPIFERRTLVRSWQKSISVARLDAALTLLADAGLLHALHGKGGQRFEVASAVLAAT